MIDNCFSSENYEGMKYRAILASLNKDVVRMNKDTVAKLSREYKIYSSHDMVKHQPEGALKFTIQFLYTFRFATTQIEIEKKIL